VAKSKSETLNTKQIINSNEPKFKQYDLEKRACHYAKRVHEYVKKPTGLVTNNEIGRQSIRSSGSVGANYMEANESLSKKDFSMF
jgi:hypothetical protein